MNNKLCVWARSSEYCDEMHHLFKGAVEYLHEIYGQCDNELNLAKGQYAIYNSNNMDLCWKPSLVQEREGTIVSSSTPLICLDEKIESEKAYTDFVFDATKNKEGYKRIFPKYFAARANNEGMDIFCDLHGLALCYVTMNKKFVAVSNHIGALAYFTDSVLEINHHGVHLFANLGWYFTDTSPYKSINRINPATVINCSSHRVKMSKWHDIGELVSPIGKSFNIDNIKAEWDVVLNNVSNIIANPPTLHLSGGKDSRITTAAWISTKKPCIISTHGIIAIEAEVATKLLNTFPGEDKLENLGITHNIYKPSSSTYINKQSLEERIRKTLLDKNGEELIHVTKYDRAFFKSPRVVFSGIDEGSRTGHSYLSEYSYNATLADKFYFENALRGWRAPNDSCSDIGLYLEEIMMSKYRDEFLSLGLDRFAMHNYFHYIERFRRWGSVTMRPEAFHLFASPAMIRECYNASPEDKRSSKISQQLTNELLPQWKGIPYYSGTDAETTAHRENKWTVWHTDPDFIKSIVFDGKFYKGYLNPQGVLRTYNKCINGEGLAPDERVLITAAILELFWGHYTELSYRIDKHRNKYYYSNVQVKENTSENLQRKVNLIDIEDESLSVNDKYKAAQELWKKKNYKEAVLMHQKIYTAYKEAYSACRCGIAYINGYGVKKNANIAATYLFIPELDNYKYAIYYRGLVFLDKSYHDYNMNKGIELLQKAYELGVKEAAKALQKYGYKEV